VARQDVGKGALAGAVGPHEGVDLPLGYREIYSLEDLLTVDGGAEPLDDEGHLSRPRRT